MARNMLLVGCMRSGVFFRLVMCGVLGWSVSARALHNDTNAAVRVTGGRSHYHSPGRQWGNFVAVSSDQDLAGNGSTSRQIFVFNLANYDCNEGTALPSTPCPNPPEPEMLQVTNGPGAPDHPTVGTKATDGTVWVAFDAAGVFGGASGLAAGRRQIFMKNLKSGELRQATAVTDGDCVKPSGSSLLGVIAFECTGTVAGFTNPTGARRVFLYDRTSGATRLVAGGLGSSSYASLNRQGTRLVFQSTSDLLGDGHDTGIPQIYWAAYDKDTGTVTRTRVTNGNGASEHPFISEEPEFQSTQWIVFDSIATNLPGVTGAGRQVYRTAALASPTFTQLTTFATYGNCSHPTLDPSGDRIAMLCTGDPLDNDSSGNRVFVLRTDTQPYSLYQMTSIGDVQPPVSANLGQWFVALSTTSDITGEGACGYQLHILNYTDGKWRAATMLGQLPQDADGGTGGPLLGGVIGDRLFEAIAGDGSGAGSEVRITTATGTNTALIDDPGSFKMVVGAPNEFSAEASVRFPSEDVDFPVVPIPGIGAMCLSAVGDGLGMLDCDGGATGGNVVSSQDHNTDDTDPFCALGCREDAVCQGSLPGPHTGEGSAAVCNGPLVTELTGSFASGGLRATMPVTFDVSVGRGIDNQFCTSDDVYSTVLDVPATLLLTTGIATGGIADRDDVAGAELSGSDLGVPFECTRLKAGDLAGARIVAALPVLDMPAIQDAVFAFQFEAKPGPVTGCNPSCSSSGDCDDGNDCNGTETCVNSRCQLGTPVVCDDGNACNGIESCDPDNGQCVPGAACDDGNPCNGLETCTQQGGCQPGTPVVCSDGNACNGVETCNEVNGSCVGGPVPNCNDSNACTDDGCSPVSGCTNTPNTNPCDDGSVCTENDHCQAGQCGGAPLVCDDGDACTDNVCDDVTGCEFVPVTCNDGNACTNDSCNSQTGCIFTANTAPCNDNSLCTTNDSCSAGACTGTALSCSDGNLCTQDLCNPDTGCVNPATICDDDNGCTADVCNPGTGACTFTATPGPCGDSDACTLNDQCVAGVCVPGDAADCEDQDPCTVDSCDATEGCEHQPINCDDDNPCTDDSCGAGGACVHTPNTAPCDDGNACTTGDTCAASACVAGAPTVCNDGNACTVDSCDSLTGCTASSPACDDDNACTDDSCNPGTGCVHAPNTASCDDASGCTLNDHCEAGACTGTAIVCGDGDVCNGAEACNPSTGTCEQGTPLACEDGDPCTIDEPCDAVDGCTFTRVPNYVVCRLGAIVDQVRAAEARALGGRVRKQALKRHSTGALRRAQAALTGLPDIATQNLQRADAKLSSFMRLTSRGVLRGKIDPEIGNPLLAQAKDTEVAIAELIRQMSR